MYLAEIYTLEAHVESLHIVDESKMPNMERLIMVGLSRLKIIEIYNCEDVCA